MKKKPLRFEVKTLIEKLDFEQKARPKPSQSVENNVKYPNLNPKSIDRFILYQNQFHALRNYFRTYFMSLH